LTDVRIVFGMSIKVSKHLITEAIKVAICWLQVEHELGAFISLEKGTVCCVVLWVVTIFSEKHAASVITFCTC
jgi:hypothetical protein